MITVQLINLDEDNRKFDLEEFLFQREYKRKGITTDDIENETDEYNDAMGILELEWDDVSDLIDEDTFDKVTQDYPDYGQTEYTNDNKESFKILLNIFSQMECEFLGYDFSHYNATSFFDLIQEKIKSSKRIAIDWVYYAN
jgi:hypothetical protein